MSGTQFDWCSRHTRSLFLPKFHTYLVPNVTNVPGIPGPLYYQCSRHDWSLLLPMFPAYLVPLYTVLKKWFRKVWNKYRIHPLIISTLTLKCPYFFSRLNIDDSYNMSHYRYHDIYPCISHQSRGINSGIRSVICFRQTRLNRLETICILSI